MSEILELKNSLLAYFESMSLTLGLPIFPERIDDEVSERTGLIYEEQRGVRSFVVQSEEMIFMPFEVTFKFGDDGVNSEIMYVQVEKTQAFYPALWLFYKSWIQDQEGQSEIYELISDFGPR